MAYIRYLLSLKEYATRMGDIIRPLEGALLETDRFDAESVQRLLDQIVPAGEALAGIVPPAELAEAHLLIVEAYGHLIAAASLAIESMKSGSPDLKQEIDGHFETAAGHMGRAKEQVLRHARDR